jgi:hypothetical protein
MCRFEGPGACRNWTTTEDERERRLIGQAVLEKLRWLGPHPGHIQTSRANKLCTLQRSSNLLIAVKLRRAWALLGLNQRPLACEASALPLS